MELSRGQIRDRRMMAECLNLALRGAGKVSPNPMVGAVLARGDTILARGWHRVFGGSHAEAECLRSYAGDCRGATLYVNLEPCSHHGKTPPCADLIIERGVGRVVAAMRDPNPLVAGRGIARLRRAGIAVELGLHRSWAEGINRFYLTGIALRRPYVHVKVAQTLDGMIAARGRSPRRISSPEAIRLVHTWRATHDAVLVGSGTIRSDDPAFTVRSAGGRDPHVVILGGGLDLPPDARVFRAGTNRRVFVYADPAVLRRRKSRARELERQGAEIRPCGGVRSRIPLRDVLRDLYRLGIGSVLVEGGAEVFSRCVGERVTDELSLFVAPFTLGPGLPSFSGPFPRKGAGRRNARKSVVTTVGRDVLVQARF
ncbi:MAG: bifunctional diaminohydroxyphosphoribosylaminopyrimidine deaminase/5-amino-6-(5-phosphoribosylamino)uracil reductase RibD [Bacteroidota bacterium]